MFRLLCLNGSALRFAIVCALVAATSCGSEKTFFPPVFEMGQLLNEATPNIEAACARTNVLEYTGDMASPYEHQTQIDCFELPVMGKPRKVEFMFNEGRLEFLWILIESAELATTEAKLRDFYGDVVFANGNDKVFASGTIALRTRPAEILIGTKELVQAITGYQQ